MARGHCDVRRLQALSWSCGCARKPAQAMYFETAAVDRGAILARVTVTGALSPVIAVRVGSQVSGRIQSLEVDFNSPVRRGQLLARIEPALFIAVGRGVR